MFLRAGDCINNPVEFVEGIILYDKFAGAFPFGRENAEFGAEFSGKLLLKLNHMGTFDAACVLAHQGVMGLRGDFGIDGGEAFKFAYAEALIDDQLGELPLARWVGDTDEHFGVAEGYGSGLEQGDCVRI